MANHLQLWDIVAIHYISLPDCLHAFVKNHGHLSSVISMARYGTEAEAMAKMKVEMLRQKLLLKKKDLAHGEIHGNGLGVLNRS